MDASENAHATGTIRVMFANKSLLIGIVAAIALATSGCSPNFNWREVQGIDPSYIVLLPAKPSSHTRDITLDGLKVTMSMTAAESEDINFAVASVTLESEAQRNTALLALQKSMLNNIHGNIIEQKNITLKDGTAMTEIQALGATSNGRKLRLYARFGVRDHSVFQVVALGPSEKLTDEIADTFLSSFSAH